MGDAGGEAADGFHLFGLDELQLGVAELLDDSFTLDGVADGAGDEFGLERVFAEVVLGTLFDHLDGEFGVGLAGQDDDGDVAGFGMDGGKRVEAAGVGE